MNIAALEIVTFGNADELREMLFENGLQHHLFSTLLVRNFGVTVPSYPIIDADVDNLDDWLQIHWEIHRAEDRVLALNTPFNLLDVDWNKETDFYEWLSSHADAHAQRARLFGL
jgi:hypothetical protein